MQKVISKRKVTRQSWNNSLENTKSELKPTILDKLLDVQEQTNSISDTQIRSETKIFMGAVRTRQIYY